DDRGDRHVLARVAGIDVRLPRVTGLHRVIHPAGHFGLGRDVVVHAAAVGRDVLELGLFGRRDLYADDMNRHVTRGAGRRDRGELRGARGRVVRAEVSGIAGILPAGDEHDDVVAARAV